jgi:class 3 adenylate cyclase
VLHFDEKDFISERVTNDLPELESWRGRYKELSGVLRVTTHFATREAFLNDQMLHDFNGVFMQGLALTRAEQVGVSAIAVVVQDATVQSGPSGLATFVENWKKTGNELRVIDLARVRAGVHLTASPLPAAQERPPRRSQRTVRAMLFADVAGFSGLPEAHLPAFFLEFLGIVEQQLKTTTVLLANTWGDGLYIVFADVVACAEFALRLLRELERIDFQAFQLQLQKDKTPGVRIGLHTGPVFEGYDAIIGKTNYFGSHVSRAARIEPVTTPGCAFVSEQFAAALAVTRGHNFVCEYLGLQPLAKGYDRCPLYRLSSRAG